MGALTIVLDIAWSRPSIASIKGVTVHDSDGVAHHPVGVVRYFSKDDTKDLHASEVPAYRAAGVLLATVYETTAGRATAGYAAGVADAHDAEAQRKQAGLGADHVHHFAVDKDVPWSAVDLYFKGVISVLGVARTGAYGGFRIIEGAYALGIRHLWQTLAWSHGQVSRHATLYQSGGTVLNGSADVNHVLAADWGQTPRPTVTPPEEDMFSDADAQHAGEAAARIMLGTAVPVVPDANDTRSVSAVLGRTENMVRELRGQATAQALQVTGLTAAVAALAAQVGKGSDVATIVTAVQEAIAHAVVHVDVTGVPAAPAPQGA